MVDPEMRRALRHPRHRRERWEGAFTVTILGGLDRFAAGRKGGRAETRSLAELALGAYVANRSELSSTDDLGPSLPPKRFANALAASSSMNSTDRTTSTPS